MLKITIPDPLIMKAKSLLQAPPDTPNIIKRLVETTDEVERRLIYLRTQKISIERKIEEFETIFEELKDRLNELA